MEKTAEANKGGKVKHPEQKEGEVYICDTTTSFFYSNIGWSTKRLGKPYPQLDGKFSGPAVYPAFVQRSEIIGQIEKEKKAGLSTKGLEKLLE